MGQPSVIYVSPLGQTACEASVQIGPAPNVVLGMQPGDLCAEVLTGVGVVQHCNPYPVYVGVVPVPEPSTVLALLVMVPVLVVLHIKWHRRIHRKGK